MVLVSDCKLLQGENYSRKGFCLRALWISGQGIC